MLPIIRRMARLRLRMILIMFVALTGANAFADDSIPDDANSDDSSSDDFYPNVWLNPGFYSYHFDQDVDLRENNIGFGAEVELKRNHVLTAGTFLNSDDERSRYAGYQWRPLHWQPAKIDVSAGLIVAAIDGYPRVSDGDWYAAILPVVSVQWKRIGVNLTVVPTIKDQLYGAVAIQFKFKVWK